jgi:hypothetical protein
MHVSYGYVADIAPGLANDVSVFVGVRGAGVANDVARLG